MNITYITYECQQLFFFRHMKPMLLLVSQRFFASNLQHRNKKKKGNDHRCLKTPLGLDSVADLMVNRNDNTVTEESYPQAFSFFLRLAAWDASSSCLRRTKSRHSTAWAILTPSCFQEGSREEIHEWTETRSRQPSYRHSLRASD